MSNPAFARQVDRAAPKRKRGFDFILLLGYAALLVIAMLLIVGKQRTLYQLGYQVVELRTTNAELKEQGDQLRAELARLTAPDRVIEKALALGLRPLPTDSIVEVRITPSQPQPFSNESEEMVAMMEGTP